MRALGAVELTSSDGTELRAVLAQPKRLALLAYLLLTPAPHFRRRDTLTALFWPELDQEHARSALRQATHFLEQALGDVVLTRRGFDEIGFDVDAVWFDVHAFDACCDRGTAVDALALYRGELLEGWFISDAAPELERWLDGERDRLRRRASEVAGLAAEKSASRGELLVAEAQARRAATLAPYDEKAIRRVLGILDVRGDRAGAVQLYDAFARRLADEYDAEPSVESKTAIADIRRRAGQTGGRQNLTKLEALFSIEREVSRSSFSTVYTAHDLRHDRVVTLKVLSPTLTAALAHERFQREIRLLARLQHRRIVPLYDSGEADGVLYYVMPFVVGDTLRERLAVQAPLAPAEAISTACQVANALAYVHAHDVVLRDLKPDGILLTSDGAVLGDFGFARAVTQAGDNRLTKTGMVLGTPAYMSPEQAGAEGEIDHRTDIYALGCVLYEMLSGHPPFAGATALAVMAKHREAPVPSLSLEGIAIDESVVYAVQRALAKSPNDRFPSAEAFGAALRGDENGASGKRV